jgi:hypothetical protein
MPGGLPAVGLNGPGKHLVSALDSSARVTAVQSEVGSWEGGSMVTIGTHIKDIIQYGNWGSAAAAILSCERKTRACCEWITANLERNDRNLAFFNILSQTGPYLELAAWGIERPIQLLAFAARSVFELNLRARHMLLSEENLNQWMSEGIVDGIQVLEGFCELRDSARPQDVAPLEAEIVRLRALASKHQIPHTGKPLGVRELVAVVGPESEYSAFFKLYSKLVHPSSYLVNRMALTWDDVVRRALAANLQLYAYDLLERVRTDLGVPEAIVAPTKSSRSSEV